jgi:3-oxoacyl-(acyl-carrier-protein) synthase
MLLAMGQTYDWSLAGSRALHQLAVGLFPAMALLSTTRDEIYNILWALVFGFATINILSLGARRFEEQRRGLNFGETLAVLVVAVSIILLGWEMLYVFNVLPIHLRPR